MRRPLAVELSAEDRSLARRWAAMSGSVYWTIVIVISTAMLASSTADKATVATGSAQERFAQDRSDPLPYGALPNLAQPTCRTSQPCLARKTSGAGATN